ncbi:MAG: hypothetical protein EOT04_00750 [Candidatus Chaera renei]|uniref:Transcription factor zinc-finger domain-containing protein n=1 Tax=Candidatus Chaera renei TaxID=2506947 RepID=A0A4Q0AK05_9BACT|nr:MAG: hypothetical protein EOT04_00750 [Candidatus Chaera renei]
MKCPVDDAELVMSERQGVEIDYCPKCRGVWLDRGELDKIIEKSGQAAPANGQGYQEPGYSSPEYNEHGGRRGDGGHGKKRGGFLSELFD